MPQAFSGQAHDFDFLVRWETNWVMDMQRVA
jgi:hypothetical protein